MSTRIRACELNSANAHRAGRRFACFFQRLKLRVRRKLTNITKNTAQFTVDQYAGYREALTGPHAMTAVFKLLMSLGSTALGIAKLVYYRQFLLNKLSGYIDHYLGPYLSKPPEPSSCEPAVFISDATREAFNAGKAAAAAAAAAEQEPEVDIDVDELDDESPQLIPLPAGVGVRPSASPRGDARDESTLPAPAPALGPGGQQGRLSPRRQPMHAGLSLDDIFVDRLGVLDDATARVMTQMRSSSTPGSVDRDDRRSAERVGASRLTADDDDDAVDVAEPLTKKRVAFRDELVDDELTGPADSPPAAGRSSVNASPPTSAHDDLSAVQPPPGAATRSSPRSTRLGMRGRPGAVGRRPMPR